MDRSRFALSVAVLAMLASAPLQAKISPDLSGKLAALPLDRLCRSDGALDMAFGAKIETKRGHGPNRSVEREMDGEYDPFVEATLDYSRYSGHFYAAEYTGYFDTEKDAEAAAGSLAKKVDPTKWHHQDVPEGVDNMYSYASKERLSDQPAPDETALTITRNGNSLIIRCEKLALSQENLDEALGKMPVGTARPVLSEYETPAPSLDPKDCDDPVKRAEIEQALDENGRASLVAGSGRIEYEEDLANWKIMKLTSSGKVDYDTITEKIIGLLDTPEAQENLDTSLDILKDLGDDLDKTSPHDDAAMCKMVLKMGQRAAAATAPKPGVTGEAITPQWRATHELLDREAARLGVSLAG